MCPLQADPVDVFELGTSPSEYTRVLAEGTYQHDKEILVGPRPRSVMGGTESGFVIITPLRNDTWHRSVLINRGWVPAKWKTDAKYRESLQPEGKVISTVMLQPPGTCKDGNAGFVRRQAL